jgi:hypothetical protein
LRLWARHLSPTACAPQSSQFDTDEHAELVFELVFSGLIESLEAPLPLRVFIVL